MQARDITGIAGDGGWTSAAARDRLSSTVFLAALVHGILILGITFSAPPAERGPLDSAMEVVLVTSQFEDKAPPKSAVLLAQRNLAGAGNAARDAMLTTRLGQPVTAEAFGPAAEGADAPTRPGTAAEATNPSQLVLARDSAAVAPDQGDPERSLERERRSLPALDSQVDILGRMAEDTAIPDARPRELLISANTRESRIASYLSNWKRKVEQVGTLNFPFAARQPGPAISPILEVAINADGQLREVTLVSSSGQRSLDDAAMQILRLAAPFEPFPAELRGEYDVLRFAYEWHFSDGGGRVRARTAAVW